MYIQGKMLDFLDKLASNSPEPGGGAVSALTGALGAALVSMVANLTVGKEKYADVQEKIKELLEKSEALRDRFQKLVQRDTEVYGVLAKAFKMPRETEEQMLERKKAVQFALREATMVPYEIAEASLELARLAEIAAMIGNVNAVSDAGVAAILAEAAGQCAALNVKINLMSIEDSAFVDEKWSAIKDILMRLGELREKVVNITYDKLG